MTDTRPASVRQGGTADLPRLEPLWTALYEHQQAHGLLAGLSQDGFQRWGQSLAPVLGRFACLFLAETGGVPVGFLAGRLRSPTAPFPPGPVGFISEVFVLPECRGGGTGRELLRQAADWFARQEVTRLELQVLTRNTQARRVYEHLGWREELVQMVCTIDPRTERT